MSNWKIPRKMQTFRAPIPLLLGVSTWLERHPGQTVSDLYVEAITEKLAREGVKTNAAVLPK